MKSRPEGIDLINIYATCNHEQWNAWLSECLRTHNINGLVDVRKRLQRGMVDLEKKKMNTEKLCVFFVRLQRSIEITLKKIHREKNPNPLYDPSNKALAEKFKEEKKIHEKKFEEFIKRESY